MATDEYSFDGAPISFSTYTGIAAVADDGRYSFGNGNKMSWSALNKTDLSQAAQQWVELADMPYCVNNSEMKRIVPGTFPRFERVWSYLDPNRSMLSSIRADNRKQFGSEGIQFKKTTDKLTIGTYTYTAENFSDNTLPKWLLIALQGGGGAGGKGASFAGDDGDGGGAGGFCMLALQLIENTTYKIIVGKGGGVNYTYKATGESGGNTTLYCNGDVIAVAYGGAGGQNYNSPGAGGTATVAESNYVKKIACVDGGKGGDGDHNTGKGGSVETKTISLLEEGSGAVHLYWLQLPGGKSPKSKAGTEGHDIGYTGSGGGSILADGGAGGDNVINVFGGSGTQGSGGGGGRYRYWRAGGGGFGGPGGDGDAMIFC